MVASALKMPRLYPPVTESPSSSPAAVDATKAGAGDGGSHVKSIVDLWIGQSSHSTADDVVSTTASSPLDGPR